MGKDSVLKLVVEEVITWVVGRELVVGILLLFIVDAVVMDSEVGAVTGRGVIEGVFVVVVDVLGLGGVWLDGVWLGGIGLNGVGLGGVGLGGVELGGILLLRMKIIISNYETP